MVLLQFQYVMVTCRLHVFLAFCCTLNNTIVSHVLVMTLKSAKSIIVGLHPMCRIISFHYLCDTYDRTSIFLSQNIGDIDIDILYCSSLWLTYINFIIASKIVNDHDVNVVNVVD